MNFRSLLSNAPWLAVAALAAYSVGAQSASAAAMPEVGQTAPNFTLPSQDGSPVSLNDFKGKWVVLYFYPKDFTSGCTIEAHNFQADIAKYEAMNAVIVGVSVDSADSHKGFCAQQGLTFKLAAAKDEKVGTTY